MNLQNHQTHPVPKSSSPLTVVSASTIPSPLKQGGTNSNRGSALYFPLSNKKRLFRPLRHQQSLPEQTSSANSSPSIRNRRLSFLSRNKSLPHTKSLDAPTTNKIDKSPGMSRRSLLSSGSRCESTDSSNCSSNSNASDLAAAKANYRIMVLGASRSGKTSIVRQFLYDKFSAGYRETVDDMYRGEFEIHGQMVGFDIQDVSGAYVYEFPGMRNVSMASADAFIIVFAMNDFASWEEANRLRDMVIEAKGNGSTTSEGIPIVVVGNKVDMETDPDIPRDTLEATVIFDWENGYVESSAKESRNINKIFKELLQQAKSKYDFTVPQLATANGLVNARVVNNSVGGPSEALKRRQSLPSVPPLLPKGGLSSVGEEDVAVGDGSKSQSNNPLFAVMSRIHGGGSRDSSKSPNNGGGNRVKRRSSVAVLRRDSCKIS